MNDPQRRDNADVFDAVSSRTIVGREEPLRLLGDVLDAASGGDPRLLLLAGEAGVGKTRLAAALEERAAALDMLVLRGECVLGGEELPYAPFAAALRDIPEDWLRGHLAGLDEELHGALAPVLPRVRAGARSR